MKSGRKLYRTAAFAAAVLLMCQHVSGGERGDPAGFLTQLDQYQQPVAPEAVIPKDFLENRIFLPAGGSTVQKLAIGMDGTKRQYRLKALWLDKGERLCVLEEREGLSESEYIRRYGNGSIENRSIPDGILYQGRKAGVTLSEPEGFDEYTWETLTDDAGTWMPVQSGASAIYHVRQSVDGSRYRCRVRTGAHEFVTGEDYYVDILRLGVIHGMKLVEEGG